MPALIVLAGPNGSGKTTLANTILPAVKQALPGIVVVNPDEIAKNEFGNFSKESFIKAARVSQRVANGGHPVPIDKITSRYYRAMKIVGENIHAVDSLNIYDNSHDKKGFKHVTTFESGKFNNHLQDNEIPEWIKSIQRLAIKHASPSDEPGKPLSLRDRLNQHRSQTKKLIPGSPHKK